LQRFVVPLYLLQFTLTTISAIIRRRFYLLQNSIFSGLSTHISSSNEIGAAAQRPSSPAAEVERGTSGMEAVGCSALLHGY
jgi:hypothetical protein